MAFQPGLPGSQFPSDDALIRRIQDLERDMRELRAANPFAPMGMKPVPGGVNITGDLAVTGTLSLPAGIINNDALANPVAPVVVNAGASGFSLTTGALQQKLSTTVPVPAGFSRAQVIANADMTAVNSTTTQDYAGLVVEIDGVGPTYTSGADTAPGRFAYCGSNFSRVLTGLGASFVLSVWASTDRAPWAANADSNVINLNAMVTFLR